MKQQHRVREVRQELVQGVSEPEKDSTCCWLEDGVG